MSMEVLLARAQPESSGCIVFTGGKMRDGYGYFRLNGKAMAAHRASWILAFGPIPNGMWVLHKCDNPPCVNPTHLFLGTAKDNARDRDKKGRNGRSKLTAEIVSTIRVMLEMGLRQKLIAQWAGCSEATISNIKQNKQWSVEATHG